MKFGIVDTYCGASGQKGFYNSQELGLARAMKPLGYEPVVFYSGKGLTVPEEELTPDGIAVVRVPAKAVGVHGRYDWNILLEYGVEAIQIGSDNQIFAPELIRFCDKNGIRVYNYLGTVGSDTGNPLKALLMGLLYRRNLRAFRTHKCFAKTPAVARRLAQLGVPDVEVAPVGLDLSVIPEITESKEALRETLKLPADKTTLLFVGRLDEYKRPLEAVRLLSKLPGAVLVMIGTGAMDMDVEREARSLGVWNRVIRIARLPNDQVQCYYAACDYYVNFNQKEIFGMSILEAMYQDCTVLACHAPGPDFIIDDGVSGFLTEDTDAMAELVRGDVRLAPGAARSRILEQFVWTNTARQFDRWLRSDDRRRKNGTDYG